MMRASLRLRMMALFTVLAGGLLAGACITFYAILSRVLTAQFDQRLLGAVRPVAADLAPEPEDLALPSGLPDDDVGKLNIPGEYFELFSDSGRLLQQSANLQGRPLDPGRLPGKVAGPVYWAFRDGRRGPMRAVLVSVQRGPSACLLLLAMPSAEIGEALAAFRRMIGFLLPTAVLITAAVSVWYVSRSLRPIADLTRHAAALAQETGDSPARWTALPVPRADDELGRLAGTFNHLFERLGALVRQMRQFVTDASHELRTPLTVLQGETELILSAPREAAEYRKSLESVDSELKNLSRIVTNLFTLAMADAGQLSILREPLALNEVLEQACALAAPLARAKGIAIERELERETPYWGDEAVLRQLFVIFLDNAVKYSPPGAPVRVDLEVRRGRPRITFADSGRGIAPGHLPHIFERFYRAGAESGPSGGGGLGLAIAQALARAHGATIECSSTPGLGSTFAVNLPAGDPDAPPGHA